MNVHASLVLAMGLGCCVLAQGQSFGLDRPSVGMSDQPFGVVTLRTLAQSPSPVAAKLVKKAQRLSAQNRHEAAIGLLKQAVELSPDYLLAHNLLGNEYDVINQFELAKSEFETMIKLDPAGAVGYTNLGIEFCKTSRFPEAETTARRALQVEPTFERAHFLLAMSLLLGHKSVREARLHLNAAARTMKEANEVLAILDAPQLGVAP